MVVWLRAAQFQPQEVSAGNLAAAAYSAAKVGDGKNGRIGPEGEGDALEAAGGFSAKSTWMEGYSVAVLKILMLE